MKLECASNTVPSTTTHTTIDVVVDFFYLVPLPKQLKKKPIAHKQNSLNEFPSGLYTNVYIFFFIFGNHFLFCVYGDIYHQKSGTFRIYMRNYKGYIFTE